jgi:hypothetical protein
LGAARVLAFELAPVAYRAGALEVVFGAAVDGETLGLPTVFSGAVMTGRVTTGRVTTGEVVIGRRTLGRPIEGTDTEGSLGSEIGG